MALVTREELKLTLGIGDLYADAILDQVIDTASNVILSLLSRKQARYIEQCCQEAGPPAIVQVRTESPHPFRVDDVVLVQVYNPTNKTFLSLEGTVIGVPEDDLIRMSFAVTIPTFAPTLIQPGLFVIDKASSTIYEAIPEVREAALAIAVDVFQSRVAPGGQTEAIDFTPGPYRLGRSLISRVSGLLARWMDTEALVG